MKHTMRRKIVAGNWKMYGSRSMASDLAGAIGANMPAEIDVAVKRMQVDAGTAEAKLQKQLDQIGSQSWSALMATLTETRAAFDRANQAAREAFKRAA